MKITTISSPERDLLLYFNIFSHFFSSPKYVIYIHFYLMKYFFPQNEDFFKLLIKKKYLTTLSHSDVTYYLYQHKINVIKKDNLNETEEESLMSTSIRCFCDH